MLFRSTFTDCSGCSSSSYPYESYTFDGTPDYTIPDTDDSDALTTDELTIGLGIRNLSKGYKGRYLTGLSRAGKFPDGWGTVTPESDSGETPPDCPDSGNVGDSYYDRNHGWCIDASVSNALEILSYGLDGDLDTLTSDVYEEDQSIDIEPNDWLVNINGATVQVDIIGDIEIENILQPATSDNISIGAGLIVYENSSSGWTITDTQYHTLLATFTDTELKVPSSSFQYSDGTDIDRGYKFKKDAPFTLSFPPKPISGTTAGHEINVPPGEHLLVLFVQHKVGTNEQTTPVFLVNRANTPTTDEIPDAGVIYTQKVKFFPGGGVPDMTLVIN